MNMKTYFTVQELCKSNTAIKYKIDNTPSDTIVMHLNQLIVFLNGLRKAWGSAIWVNSGYRCPKLNTLVGGSSTSAHLNGYAADLWPGNGNIDEFKTFVANYCKDKAFDQLLLESSGKTQWVHIGLYSNSGKQRKQIKYMKVN